MLIIAGCVAFVVLGIGFLRKSMAKDAAAALSGETPVK
jgi:hypothetical protein